MQRRTENICRRPSLLEINLTNVFVEEASVALYTRIEEYTFCQLCVSILVTKECPLSLNVNLIGKNIHSKSEKENTFCQILLIKNQLSLNRR